VPTAQIRNWPGIRSGKRALGELGIEWKDVMAFGVHSDRIVIIEGPAGFKRTWWFPEARAEAGAAG
jgi:hypothetical protein